MPRLQAQRTTKLLKKSGARETINSGATFSDGDATLNNPIFKELGYSGCVIEAKSTQNKSFSLTKDLWEKHRSESMAIGKMPLFMIDLEKYNRTLVTMDYNDLLAILQKIEELIKWRETVIDKCVVSWVVHDPNNPELSINNLIQDIQRETLDPAISQDAIKLIEKYGGKYDENKK